MAEAKQRVAKLIQSRRERGQRQVSLFLRSDALALIDRVKTQAGLPNRSDALEILLRAAGKQIAEGGLSPALLDDHQQRGN